MTKQYKVLLMDLDNTLFDFEHSEKTALWNTYNQYASDIDYAHFENTYHEVNKPLWQALERGETDSETIKIERFGQLVERLKLTCDPVQMSVYYMNRLGEGIALFPNAEEVCHRLKEQYQLVALTNGIKQVQESRMMRSGLIQYFDALIISEAVGYSKPHPRIFEYALDKVGHYDKETVLMIGDSMKADIHGAHQMGIDTCWVNLKGDVSPENPVFKWEVNKLMDLLNFL